MAFCRSLSKVASLILLLWVFLHLLRTCRLVAPLHSNGLRHLVVLEVLHQFRSQKGNPGKSQETLGKLRKTQQNPWAEQQVVLVGDSGERDPFICAELLRRRSMLGLGRLSPLVREEILGNNRTLWCFHFFERHLLSGLLTYTVIPIVWTCLP